MGGRSRRLHWKVSLSGQSFSRQRSQDKGRTICSKLGHRAQRKSTKGDNNWYSTRESKMLTLCYRNFTKGTINGGRMISTSIKKGMHSKERVIRDR